MSLRAHRSVVQAEKTCNNVTKETTGPERLWTRCAFPLANAVVPCPFDSDTLLRLGNLGAGELVTMERTEPGGCAVRCARPGSSSAPANRTQRLLPVPEARRPIGLAHRSCQIESPLESRGCKRLGGPAGHAANLSLHMADRRRAVVWRTFPGHFEADGQGRRKRSTDCRRSRAMACSRPDVRVPSSTESRVSRARAESWVAWDEISSMALR